MVGKTLQSMLLLGALSAASFTAHDTYARSLVPERPSVEVRLEALRALRASVRVRPAPQFAAPVQRKMPATIPFGAPTPPPARRPAPVIVTKAPPPVIAPKPKSAPVVAAPKAPPVIVAKVPEAPPPMPIIKAEPIIEEVISAAPVIKEPDPVPLPEPVAAPVIEETPPVIADIVPPEPMQKPAPIAIAEAPELPSIEEMPSLADIEEDAPLDIVEMPQDEEVEVTELTLDDILNQSTPELPEAPQDMATLEPLPDMPELKALPEAEEALTLPDLPDEVTKQDDMQELIAMPEELENIPALELPEMEMPETPEVALIEADLPEPMETSVPEAEMPEITVPDAAPQIAAAPVKEKKSGFLPNLSKAFGSFISSKKEQTASPVAPIQQPVDMAQMEAPSLPNVTSEVPDTTLDIAPPALPTSAQEPSSALALPPLPEFNVADASDAEPTPDLPPLPAFNTDDADVFDAPDLPALPPLNAPPTASESAQDTIETILPELPPLPGAEEEQQVASLPQAETLPPLKELNIGGYSDKNTALSVLFSQSETEVPLAYQQPLINLSKELINNGNSQIKVVAYASSSEDQRSIARRISLARALAVRAFLIDLGIDNVRISVQALGNEVPEGPSERADIIVSSGA